jgi:hypothetical protein
VSDRPAVRPVPTRRARLHVTREHTQRDGRTGRAPSVPDDTVGDRDREEVRPPQNTIG